MGQISFNISQHEKDELVKALRKFKGKTVSVAAVAKEAGLNPNRARFIVEELLQEGRIKREPTKAFNKNYIRYTYEVLK